MTDEELIAAANERRVKRLIKQAKAEAYKEFTEMLRNLDFEIRDGKVSFDWKDFNNLLKEMEGGLL